MTGNKRRSSWIASFVVGSIALGLSPSQARAQFGMGMGGFGWGWGGFGYVAPSPTNFIQQHALTAAARGREPRPSHSPYANNPNAYFNRIRDNGFVSHYDVRRRQPPSYQNRRSSSGSPSAVVSQPSPAGTAADAILPLASFFNAARTLVWPNESPTADELKEKRVLADQAILAVLDETTQQPSATVGSVTTARQKLLDYGQPALKEIRIQSTPPIADAFHRFLLSLYDSLALAAWPPSSASDGSGRR